MSGNEAVKAVIEALESHRIPYMVVGSYASNVYGIERSTQDADVVVELGDASISEILRGLAPTIRLDPQMCFEGATTTRRFVADVVGIPFKIEFFLLGEDHYDRERFGRRREADVLGRRVFIPAVEDVIITKLRWALHLARSKDRDDARDVIAVQGDRIDWDYVHRWCEEHGTRALLDEIRASIPPI
ncbi:MAG TPA: hypothetical protein VG406_01505 [Isosphaeraceae bacterium]|jgi:hypothetical protein|nr:hypothetical protein [Isosphaeraceae bacterium]